MRQHRPERALDPIAGYGKADPNIAPGRTEQCSVDAHHLTGEIDQGAAGIARIDRGICLNQMTEPITSHPAAPHGADDPRGHRLAKSERIADHDDKIPHLQGIGITQTQPGNRHRRDAQQRGIRAGIATEQACLKVAMIFQTDSNLGRLLDHMGVGQHIAALAVDDKTRTDTAPAFGAALLRWQG